MIHNIANMNDLLHYFGLVYKDDALGRLSGAAFPRFEPNMN